MTNIKQNVALGVLLLVLAAVWMWLVIDTIPDGFGGGDIGPRAFPFFFGVALAVLSAILLAQNVPPLLRDLNLPRPDAIEPADPPIHWWPALMVLIEIALYGVLMQKCGFVIATFVIVLLVMVVNLRVRSWKLLLGMSLGTAFGCWILFEKILGIYLANGSWMNLG